MSAGHSVDLQQRIGTPVHAVVPAAGSGSRYGSEIAKQFLILGGRPLLEWTVDAVLAGGVSSLTVSLPEDLAEDPPAWLANRPGVRCVAGGATRQASVALALLACPARESDWVLVHDGARPALHADDLLAVVLAAAGSSADAGEGGRGADGAVLGRLQVETMKRIEGGRVISTVPRDNLFRAETPQLFRREVLEAGYREAAKSRFVGTDESSVVERLPGVRIVAVHARHANPKVTTPADLPLVEALLSAMGSTGDSKS